MDIKNCHGLTPNGGLIPFKECQQCPRHEKSKAECILLESLASVPPSFKTAIIKTITKMQDGTAIKEFTSEEMLRTVSVNLAILHKKGKITLEQSADVLSIAMKSYKCGAKKRA
ncbi:MAG: hypothetical protein FWG91_13830 [Lachnospiraceae bacterium]|nr:hypothetical protein [Lachnospiraceae bacterium]